MIWGPTFWAILLLALFIAAWVRVEYRRGNRSSGLVSMILGSLLFAWGEIGLKQTDTFLAILVTATGLFIALHGLGRFREFNHR